MKCEKCNNVIDPSYSVCPYCGNLVKKAENIQPNNNLNVQQNVSGMSSNVQSNNNVNSNVQSTNNFNAQQTVIGMSSYARSNNGTKKKNKGLIAIIVIILVVIGALIGGLFYFSSPKQIFNLAINKATNPVIKSIGSDYDSYITEFEFKGNLNVDEELDEDTQGVVDLINGLSLKGKFGYDYNNKKAVMELEGNYEDDEIAAAKMYLKDSKAYFYLENMFDKYISIDVEDYDKLFEKSDLNKDLQVVIKEGRNSLKSSLKNEYFEKEKVGGYTKNTLGISEKVFAEITISMFKELKENDKFLTSVCNISGMKKQDIIDMLNESINEISSFDDYDTEVIFEISIYTKGFFGSIAKVELKENMDDFSIVVEKISKDNYKYSFKEANEELLKGKIYCKEEKNSLDLKVSVSIEGTELELDFKYNIDTKGKIEDINTNNSINYTELTEDDLTNILNNLSKNKGFERLVEDIDKLNFDDDSFSEDTDDDYLNGTVVDGAYKLSYFGDKPEVYVNIPKNAEVLYHLTTILSFYYNNDINVSLEVEKYDSPKEYFSNIEEITIPVLEDVGYKNIKLSDMKESNFNNRKFYYKDLNYTYEAYSYVTNYHTRYICVQLSEDLVYSIEIEANDQEIPNDLINMLLNYEAK